MKRTQIYLTEKERSFLDSLSEQSGKKLSELIREAVDDLIERYSKKRKSFIIDKVAGIWQNRKDLEDFSKIRQDWDRDYQ